MHTNLFLSETNQVSKVEVYSLSEGLIGTITHPGETGSDIFAVPDQGVYIVRTYENGRILNNKLVNCR